MTAGLFDHVERLKKLSTTNVSDALDSLSLKGATSGIHPMWENTPKIAGQAVTIKLIPADSKMAARHLGIQAITQACPGNIVVIDNSGRLDVSSWGGILANGAQVKGIAGVVIDGACRDIDDFVALQFPVYAKTAVIQTARRRVIEAGTNIEIQFAGVSVRPGDFVLADRSGVVIIPQERIEEVITKAESLMTREQDMIKEIQNGASMIDVDRKYSYEKMLG